jgi:hypothetical protein
MKSMCPVGMGTLYAVQGRDRSSKEGTDIREFPFGDPRHALRPQSTYIPRVPQYLFPRPNWDLPNPFPASECVPPPEPGGERHTCLRGRGSQFGRMEKKKPSTLSVLRLNL